jgi:hypothetical protein
VKESVTWQFEFQGGAVCNSTSSYSCGIDRFFASADNGFFAVAPALGYGPRNAITCNGVLNFPTINQQAAQCDEIAKLLLDYKPLSNHITGE